MVRGNATVGAWRSYHAVSGRENTSRRAQEPAKMSLDEDRKLLMAFRQGKRWALEKVYKQHVDGVARFLRGGFVFESSGSTVRFAGAPSEFQLEDWVHDVFIRAFSDSARNQYDGLRPYGPYLQRIARNLVLDELRRKEHQLRTHVEELPEPEVSTGYAPDQLESPDAAAERRQLDKHVQSYVAQLPKREREVYNLRFIEGLDQREVAERAGLSPSKVKTSERRIRAGFYEHLRALGWLDGSAADALQEATHV